MGVTQIRNIEYLNIGTKQKEGDREVLRPFGGGLRGKTNKVR